MKTVRWRPLLWLILVAVLGQVLASVCRKEFYLTQVTMSVYYSLVVMGLCLLMGHTGQASLGHGAFFAMGGYLSAILTTHDFKASQGAVWFKLMNSLGLMVTGKNTFDGSDVVVMVAGGAFLVAMLFTLVVAVVVGYPSLRLKGHYLAIATLGFGLIVYRILLGSPWAGAADGINGVPPWTLGWGIEVSGKSEVRVVNYYVAWGLAWLVAVLLVNLMNSRVGRAWRAIHDHETAANAMGVNTARLKLQAFVVSALLAALGGCFLTHFNGGIGPSEASAMKSVRYVALVAAGGMDNLWGALVMSVVLNSLSLRGYFGTLDNVVFGLILIVIVSVTPEGPFKPARDWVTRWAKRWWRPEGENHGAP